MQPWDQPTRVRVGEGRFGKYCEDRQPMQLIIQLQRTVTADKCYAYDTAQSRRCVGRLGEE